MGDLGKKRKKKEGEAGSTEELPKKKEKAERSDLTGVPY